jgi:hypothetical protein
MHVSLLSLKLHSTGRKVADFPRQDRPKE